MDTRTATKAAGAAAAKAVGVEEQLMEQRLQVIRQCMPLTLACIKDRGEHFGPEAFNLVRRALRGEPGCFYAIEAGHVVGNPAGLDRKVLTELAGHMVVFGCAHVCIWPERVWIAGKGAGDGAH